MSHLCCYTFFLHGYADGRPRTATNPQHNIPTLIFKPIYVLSGLSHILYNILTSRLLDFHMHQLANWHRKYIPSPPSNGRTTTALVPFDSYINWAQCFPKIGRSTLHPSNSTIISYTTTHMHHSMLNSNGSHNFQTGSRGVLHLVPSIR